VNKEKQQTNNTYNKKKMSVSYVTFNKAMFDHVSSNKSLKSGKDILLL